MQLAGADAACGGPAAQPSPESAPHPRPTNPRHSLTQSARRRTAGGRGRGPPPAAGPPPGCLPSRLPGRTAPAAWAGAPPGRYGVSRRGRLAAVMRGRREVDRSSDSSCSASRFLSQPRRMPRCPSVQPFPSAGHPSPAGTHLLHAGSPWLVRTHNCSCWTHLLHAGSVDDGDDSSVQAGLQRTDASLHVLLRAGTAHGQHASGRRSSTSSLLRKAERCELGVSLRLCLRPPVLPPAARACVSRFLTLAGAAVMPKMWGRGSPRASWAW